MGLATALVILPMGMLKVPPKKLIGPLIPLLFILFFTLVANSFVFQASDPYGLYSAVRVSPGIFAQFDPVVLVADFAFYPAGFGRGLFYCLRIILLFWSSLLVAVTTSHEACIDATLALLAPLRRLGVPVEDIAMIVSIALRFVPVVATEFEHIYRAQQSRCAAFDSDKLRDRLRVWSTVLTPLFVGMFRRSLILADAMDARCYGYAEERGSLHVQAPHGISRYVCAIAIAACIANAYFF